MLKLLPQLALISKQTLAAVLSKAFRGLPVAERMPEPTEEQRAWYGRRPEKVRAMSVIGCRSMMASNAFHNTGRRVAIPEGVPFAEPFTTRHAAPLPEVIAPQVKGKAKRK